MRVTRYVKAFEGDNWMVVQLRCSAHVAYYRLDALMLKNGWIRWSEVCEKFNALKKKIAKTDPVKYPNWKEVEIPMISANVKNMPTEIVAENEAKNVELVTDGT